MPTRSILLLFAVLPGVLLLGVFVLGLLMVRSGSAWTRSAGCHIARSVHGNRCRSLRGLGDPEEHTSELQSLMRISYAVFCLKKKKKMHIGKRIHNKQRSPSDCRRAIHSCDREDRKI